MDTDIIIHDIEYYIEKLERNYNGKFLKKIEKILLENKYNEELFDKLINHDAFTRSYHILDETMPKLGVNVQKKIINMNEYYFEFASEEIRNDKEYIDALQTKVDNDPNILFKPDFYRHIGEKLSGDPDYLLSIQDKSPKTFAESVGKVNYPEKVVVDFVEKHPFYLEILPDHLKNDYNYICDLMDMLPNYTALVSLEFEYLKQEQIKTAILDKFGAKAYHYIITQSFKIHDLDKDKKFLKQLSTEDLKDLLLMDPALYYENDDIRFLFSRKKSQMISTIQDIAEMKSENINSPEKLAKVLYKLSAVIGKGLSYNEILSQLTPRWNLLSAWVAQVGHDMYIEEINMPDRENFYSVYNILIGIENNMLDNMLKVFDSKELRSSLYASGLKDVEVTNENIGFLQLVGNYSFFERDAKNLDMYNLLYQRISAWNKDPYATIIAIELIGRDNNLVNLLKAADIKNMDQDLLLNIYNYVYLDLKRKKGISSLDELKDLSAFIKNVVDHESPNKLNDKKNMLLLKHFQMSILTARDFLNSYCNSKEDSELYQKMPEILYLKQILSKIVYSTSEEEIKIISDQLANNEQTISFKDINNIKNKIKEYYGLEIEQSLLKVDKPGEIIDVTNEKFNMLVHVIGAYGSTPPGNIYESWNTADGRDRVSICTSFISNNNMGTAYTTENSVILGFANLPEGYLEIMGCDDLSSSGFSSKKQCEFLNPEELVNNTRHTHNEVVIRRREGQYTESKVQPSYIICFDSINDKSKEAAQSFQIPIVFVNREKVAEKNNSNIINMVEQFKTTLDPKLITNIICEQENNRAGMRANRPDLVEKYFSQDFRQQNMMEIYTAINKGLENNHPNAIAAMQTFVESVEAEEEKFKVPEESAKRRNYYDLNHNEFVKEFKNNPNFNQEKSISIELTYAELYEKFIKCREKLSQSESLELQELNNRLMEQDNIMKAGRM